MDRTRSGLYEIQDAAIEIAKTISVMLLVDVEIIDRNHMVVAGTGHFKGMINKSNRNIGHGYRAALTRGEKMINTEPGTGKYCLDCNMKDKCDILFEVGYPIICGDRIEGLIGITCYEEKRREFFERYMKESLYFLDQMCELLADKISERVSMQRHLAASKMFDNLLKYVEKGILILSEASVVSELNQAARDILVPLGVEKGTLVNVILADEADENDNVYRLAVDDRVFTVVGRLENFENRDETYSRILIFQTLLEYRNRRAAISMKRETKDVSALIGHSAYVSRLKEEIQKAADNVVPVLLEGESGTGKKLTAAAIWKSGPRSEKPYYYFDSTAESSEKIRDLLFGVQQSDNRWMRDESANMGMIEKASGGTLYIDKVDSLSLELQQEIYHVITRNAILRRNGKEEIPVDVRFMFSTENNLLKMVEEGRFQKDLYFCIGVCRMKLLPLRRRKEDIPDYVSYYIKEYAEKYRLYFKEVDGETMELLVSHPWFGNVDELKTVIEYMVNAMSESGVLDKNTLPADFGGDGEYSDNEIIPLDQLEKREIQKALAIFGNTKKGKEKAAEALGIGIATLYRKL